MSSLCCWGLQLACCPFSFWSFIAPPPADVADTFHGPAYGYTCDGVPPNNDELQSLAGGAVEAIRSVHGLEFGYGPICSTIYRTAGSSVDYVNDVVKSDYSFTSELRDTGRYGFILPADQIVPSGDEAFAGVKYLLQNMK